MNRPPSKNRVRIIIRVSGAVMCYLGLWLMVLAPKTAGGDWAAILGLAVAFAGIGLAFLPKSAP